jgi:hypothetical protein
MNEKTIKQDDSNLSAEDLAFVEAGRAELAEPPTAKELQPFRRKAWREKHRELPGKG